ncbi:MAG TPA: PEP-CTERM sorting domain-containing protein [Methylophilaceae bacterium]|nr:PEP-CTERM sorting domain-containing protein [Methylophilaceae bacterium]
MSKLFCRLWVGSFLLFGLSLTSNANEIVHWELNAFMDVPGASTGQQRTFTGSFDYNLLTKAVSNFNIKSVGSITPNCLLCEEYTDALAFVLYDPVTGTIPQGVQSFKEVPPSESGVIFEAHTLQIFGFDITQPGTFGGLFLNEFISITLDRGLDPEIIVQDYCEDCATLTGTLQPIPEPETYAMLLAGVGVLGWRARSKKIRH